jgi:Notch-like protein
MISIINIQTTYGSFVCFLIEELSPFFTPQQCNGSINIGVNCNISSNPCDMLKPCKNNGRCNNTHTNTHLGYNCSCSAGFNGTHCEFDHRLCTPNTCWNNGISSFFFFVKNDRIFLGTFNETSNTTFICSCAPGWEGDHCERKINYCLNVTCMNNGVCEPLLLNYTCECLSNSYSGRHCEITAKKIIIYKIVSKSFAYIAIIAMVSVAMFVVIMDILKYCFGIDSVSEERERFQREKRTKRRKRPVNQ